MSIEIEYRGLGSLMILGNHDDILAQEAFLVLQEIYFYNRDNRIVFKLIRKLFDSHQSFDSGMLMSLVDSEQFELIVHIIQGQWTKNSLLHDIKYLSEYHQQQIVKEQLSMLVRQFELETVPSIACDIATQGCIDIGNIGGIPQTRLYTTERYLEELLTNQHVHKQLIPCGIKTIDDLMDGGFKENCLITIAGRSGMGKTCFAVHLAYHIARNHPNQHVLFFSLEMSASDIYEKQITTIMRKQYDGQKLSQHVIDEMMNTQFTILEEPMASIKLIETTSRITAIKKPISVIVVDYLSIVQNDSKFESNALKQADIAMRLAALAKELNCIVIALTQVNRGHADRKDKNPITSDAADSSGSERSSTYWFGIYRPKVDEESLHDEFMVSCRKNRFGKTWQATFAFENATFREISQQWISPIDSSKGYNSYQQKKGN